MRSELQKIEQQSRDKYDKETWDYFESRKEDIQNSLRVAAEKRKVCVNYQWFALDIRLGDKYNTPELLSDYLLELGLTPRWYFEHEKEVKLADFWTWR